MSLAEPLSVPPELLTALCLVLFLPAVARATRLVTRDKMPLLALPREAFVQRWGTWEDAKGDERRLSINGRKTNALMASLAYLWECDWCASVWIAGGLGYLTWRFPAVAVWLLVILTASYAAGWSATAESCVNEERE
jgi:hypothetical protein